MNRLEGRVEKLEYLIKRALAKAAGGGAVTALQNRAALTPVVSADAVNAPSNYTVAAAALTPAASGYFEFGFGCAVNASAADTFAMLMHGIPGPGVVVAAGTLQGGVRYSAGSQVTVVGGGAPVTVAGAPAGIVLPAGDLLTVVTLTGAFQAPLGGTSALRLSLDSATAKNYASASLWGWIHELP